MRPYNRHKTKHGEYFEGLAADVLRDGPTTVSSASSASLRHERIIGSAVYGSTSQATGDTSQ
jgi:hypothetical protein